MHVARATTDIDRKTPGSPGVLFAPALRGTGQRWRTIPPPLGAAGAEGGGGAAETGPPIGIPGEAAVGAATDGATGACRVAGTCTCAGAGAGPGTTIVGGIGVPGCARVTGRVTFGAAGTTWVGGGTAPT